MSEPRLASFLLILYVAGTAETWAKQTNLVTSFNGLRNDYNLGHMGYVYLGSDTTIPELELSSCQKFDVNHTTCSFSDNPSKAESVLMVLRAWIATTIRDNVLDLLGYLMHHPQSKSFHYEMKSSLRIVYEEILRNSVRMMDLLPRIRSIAKMNQANQALSLLKLLRNVLPPFSRNAASEISRYFSNRKELLTNILRSSNGLDLFADVRQQMLVILRLKSSNRRYDADVQNTMGKEFAIFFTAIQKGRITLTQPVLAALILNMKFNGISSTDIEKLRFFCDVLRLNKIHNWTPGLSRSCCANFNNPYSLVQTMMEQASENHHVDEVVRATIVELLPRLTKSFTYDRDSFLMEQFFANSTLNVMLFLETLEDEARIPEVAVFGNLVMDGTINLAYAFKGFVRYYYDTPRKLVLAIVERTKYRVPMSVDARIIVETILMNLRESGETFPTVGDTQETLEAAP